MSVLEYIIGFHQDMQKRYKQFEISTRNLAESFFGMQRGEWNPLTSMKKGLEILT